MPFTYEDAVKLIKSPEQLELEVDDEHLDIIGKSLKDWKLMAPALQFISKQVDAIIAKYPTTYQLQGPELLKVWKEGNLNTTYAKLLQACADIEDAKTAKEIARLLNSSKTPVLAKQDSVTAKPIEPTSSTEHPSYSEEYMEELIEKYKPERPPKNGSQEHAELTEFSQEVEIILQTVNENEYYAATTFLEPPTENFLKSVVFPSAGIVLGNFADHKVALIQTDVGANAGEYIENAIENFPNAQFIIGVGVGYAFDRKKYQFGDVLVSKKISDLRNWKFNKDNKVVNRGQIIDVVNTLHVVFCKAAKFDERFQVTRPNIFTGEVRYSKVHVGTFASFAVLMDNKEMRDKFGAEVPEVMGGEMEGGELLKFPTKKDNNIDGVIVIKGVVDYGDGDKDKRWQFTAAMAALTYTRDKLFFYRGQGKIEKAVAKERFVPEEEIQRGAAKGVKSGQDGKFPKEKYFGRSAPEMRDLSFIKNRKGEKFRFLSLIASHWKDISAVLGLNVVEVDRIAKRHGGDVDEQIRSVFKIWMDNATELPNSKYYPLSWHGLNEILLDSDLAEVAKKYFEFLNTCD